MTGRVSLIDIFAPGSVEMPDHRFRCALGPAGIKASKTEGDGATPSGTFTLRRVFYRADRIKTPRTSLPLQALSPTDGWCDDSDRKKYNRLVTLPFSGSHEDLWREDHIYDIIVELGFNDNPPVPGQGSAIFMHIAREAYEPTQGCIALAIEDLLIVLAGCDENTRIRINLPQV